MKQTPYWRYFGMMIVGMILGVIMILMVRGILVLTDTRQGVEIGLGERQYRLDKIEIDFVYGEEASFKLKRDNESREFDIPIAELDTIPELIIEFQDLISAGDKPAE